jgi:hypothetical protein
MHFPHLSLVFLWGFLFFFFNQGPKESMYSLVMQRGNCAEFSDRVSSYARVQSAIPLVDVSKTRSIGWKA